jgi:hypothetical protein
MNARDLAAGLGDLMANPFIPELHEDDCPDSNCSGCIQPEAPAWQPQPEDPHSGPLSTRYELGRDMPETTA